MTMDHILRRFTIRTRMLGAIGIVATVLMLVGGAGLFGLANVSKSVDSIVNGALVDATKLSELRLSIQAVSSLEKDMVINFDAPDKVVEVRKKWQQAIQDTRRAAITLGDHGSAARKESAQKIEKALFVYERRSANEADSLEGGLFKSASEADEALARPRKDAARAHEELAQLTKLVNADAQAQRDDSVAATRLVSYVFVAVVVGALLLIVPLTLMNMISICRPLDRACEVAGRIAGGDLTAEIDAEGSDESARLMRALRDMQHSLGSIVGEVRYRSDSMRTACVEVAAGNQDLSGRTEQTASSLQQTSSSMEQLTGTVRQTADSARTANQLASSAAQAARRGGDVVSQVVANMEEISASSRKIADIIGVIDGIAFQTNILALNAAVEAARAGEQGRGFAVVATEVRNLAQRSANAAKEIKTLIGASVEKVESGSRLVQDAGSTMNEIVSGVQRVTDIIGEITAASTDQANELVQVNSAVTQLDQMTQQNAALVEESAAAAESLNQQAEKLAELVANFRCAPADNHPTADASQHFQERFSG